MSAQTPPRLVDLAGRHLLRADDLDFPTLESLPTELFPPLFLEAFTGYRTETLKAMVQTWPFVRLPLGALIELPHVGPLQAVLEALDVLLAQKVRSSFHRSRLGGESRMSAQTPPRLVDLAGRHLLRADDLDFPTLESLPTELFPPLFLEAFTGYRTETLKAMVQTWPFVRLPLGALIELPHVGPLQAVLEALDVLLAQKVRSSFHRSRLGGESRMSAQTPPRLVDLAGRHLLRADDLDFPTLESLPTELFPPLFLEAFTGYRTETLKAMVQTWPFVRLPLGALIELPHVGPLQAVLEALDVLLAQKVRSSFHRSRLGGESRMSAQTPPRLVDLAGRHLLRADDLDFPTLESLPTELFLPLFLEAFTGYRTETLKAMVQTWPFVRLPLGALIELPHVGPLQAVLEALDVLLAQKVRSSFHRSRLGGESRMSAQTPPRLVDLAGRHLLRADDLDFPTLESLPTELFPPLFLEAFTGYRTETLKAMVQTWPFVRLPLGALIELPHVGPLQAVLEALDVLLAQKVRSSFHRSRLGGESRMSAQTPPRLVDLAGRHLLRADDLDFPTLESLPTELFPPLFLEAFTGYRTETLKAMVQTWPFVRLPLGALIELPHVGPLQAVLEALDVLLAQKVRSSFHRSRLGGESRMSAQTPPRLVDLAGRHLLRADDLDFPTLESLPTELFPPLFLEAFTGYRTETLKAMVQTWPFVRLPLGALIELPHVGPLQAVLEALDVLLAQKVRSSFHRSRLGGESRMSAQTPPRLVDLAGRHLLRADDLDFPTLESLPTELFPPLFLEAFTGYRTETLKAMVQTWPFVRLPLGALIELPHVGPLQAVLEALDVLLAQKVRSSFHRSRLGGESRMSAQTPPRLVDLAGRHLLRADDLDFPTLESLPTELFPPLFLEAFTGYRTETLKAMVQTWPFVRLPLGALIELPHVGPLQAVLEALDVLLAQKVRSSFHRSRLGGESRMSAQTPPRLVDLAGRHLLRADDLDFPTLESLPTELFPPLFLEAFTGYRTETLKAMVQTWPFVRLPLGALIELPHVGPLQAVLEALDVLLAQKVRSSFHRSRLGGESRMSAQTPPRLVDLAGRHLLRADDLDFPTLESLPTELFPPLFLEAFTGYRTETLKAMVQTWPFVRLPLGALIELPHVGPLQAVLEALDVLLAQKVRSSFHRSRLGGESRMSAQTPPRLVDLAGRHLLRADDLDFPTLESLPTELFPPLFLEAFTGYRTETLKAMVQTWPFVRLPLGALIELPHVGPLQAVLEALDVLLAQKVRSSFHRSRLGGESRMSAQTPPRLVDLAGRHLLRADDLDFPTLESLPTELFPPLFLEAFTGYRTETLKAMVQTWPFVRLPLGALIELPHVGPLQAVLEALDVLLAQKVRSSFHRSRLGGESRMSAQTPPRLVDLAGRHLLRADDLDFPTLESLPTELFPPLFLEAFTGYRTETLKAMVQTWPFVRLPLGALIELPHVGPLQAVLEALDVLLAQKVRSSFHRSRLGGESRMSAQTPPRLVDLAGRHLLRADDLDFPTLESLPTELFPPLFLEAFTGYRTETLKAMVQTWPFVRLPLGALIELPHVGPLQAVLEALDVLLAQKVRSSFHRSRLGGESRMSAQTPPRLVDLAGRHLLRADDLDFPTLESLPTELFPPLFLEAFTGYRTETLKAMVQTWPFVRLPLGALIELPHVGPLQAVLEALDVLLAQKVRSSFHRSRLGGESRMSAQTPPRLVDLAGRHLLRADDLDFPTLESLPTELFPPLFLEAFTGYRTETLKAMVQTWPFVRLPLGALIELPHVGPLQAVLEALDVLLAQKVRSSFHRSRLGGESRMSAQTPPRLVDLAGRHLLRADDLDFPTLESLPTELFPPLFLEAFTGYRTETLKAMVQTWPFVRLPLGALIELPHVGPLQAVLEALDVLLAQKVRSSFHRSRLGGESRMSAQTPPRLVDLAGRHLLRADDLDFPTLESLPTELFPPLFLEAFTGYRTETLKAMVQTWPFVRLPLGALIELPHVGPLQAVLEALDVLLAQKVRSSFHRSRLGGESRMSAQTPPRLVDLAGRHLLRADDLDFPTLESLPTELFPPLFLEAFTGYRTETLKAMVQTWPFVRLPLGALIELPHVGPLQAVLEALDVLLAQKVRSSFHRSRLGGESRMSAQTPPRLVDLAGRHLLRADDLDFPTLESLPTELFPPLFLEAFTGYRTETLKAMVQTWPFVRLPLGALIELPHVGPLQAVLEALDVLLAQKVRSSFHRSRLGGESRMSAQTPPRLVDLAGRHLLRADDLDFPTLESLPTELFPPLFLEAFTGYRTETLKAMVQTWPFVRLPLGALIELPHVGPLQAVLEALDVLLAQKVRSSFHRSRLGGESRMSAQTPPRLVDLAGRHLLRADDLDFPTLESLPTELFPPLFLEAFTGYRTETLKAMVQTWPFVRLPLGALIELPHVGPLQAVLEALDVLLAQKVRSSFHRSRLGGESRMSAQTPPRLVDLAGRHLLRADDLDFPTLESLPTELFPPLFLEAFTGYRTETLKAMVQTWPFVRLPLGALIELPHVGPLQAVLEALDVLLAQKVRSSFHRSRLGGESRMSAQTPPRLVDLAGRHLLRADDLDFPTLESLPTELFPPLFLEAFTGYRTETLKAMVQTWPFVRLPLGALIELPHVGPLQAVLEALDVLLAQKVRSSFHRSRLGGESRMSAQTPPRLVDLAGRHLLRADDLDFPTLESLPTELFPPLFLEAFTGYRTETLKAMVQTWPFVRLPLGALIELPHVGPLQAVLEALDVLLAQKVRSSFHRSRLGGESRMSAQTPPRLVDLAGRHLLRADDLDFPTLESLPTELFPPLFLEAFTGYRTETLKAMVQTWPFVRLPLGALIELPHVGPLQAVLEALDVLLAQKVRSSFHRSRLGGESRMSAQTPPRLVDLAGRHLLRADDLDFPTLESLPTELFPPLFLEAFTGYRTETLKAMVQTWPFVRLPLGALIELPHVGPLQAVLEALDVLLAQKVRSSFHRSRLGGESRMSAQTPPRLVDLAGRHLLRADDLDFPTLESLPTELFPPLFLEAFTGYRTETLKAMVQTWPFVRLPLGALIELPHVGPLQAVLEALDVLLAQKVRSSFHRSRLGGESRMSAQTPPRLVDLAGRHLLRADDLDFPTLESLPTELFPPLFLEAFTGYRTETLKAMVQTWPFVRLPLGALIELPHVGPLQAVLEALDVLLAQKVRSSFHRSRLGGESRMSAQTPPRLVDLAGRHLLRADDLDFPTLESLPTELFPPLFLEAFTGYRTETLKAMVQTWPFVRLPLGALIELPHVGPLQAVLEALDVLLAQKVRSSFHRSRLGGESRMSAQTPPRLVDLAGRHLLRADDLDFPTLESLPTELFPPLFLEAFTGYRTETLKAMVQTWPFVRLPLGALIELPHVGPLQAVLEALDVLLAQKVRSR
ncbi:hypothetical protein R6Z07M_011707 [Ovis aries]